MRVVKPPPPPCPNDQILPWAWNANRSIKWKASIFNHYHSLCYCHQCNSMSVQALLWLSYVSGNRNFVLYIKAEQTYESAVLFIRLSTTRQVARKFPSTFMNKTTISNRRRRSKETFLESNICQLKKNKLYQNLQVVYRYYLAFLVNLTIAGS